ncbi:MAG: type II toxin-antitoxin system RelE/ParE family toxin [Acidimicrobiales bacterium]|nr:type II toxin-antitoxin system RelE/ParE family toxin [Acidimicrobiales bacterium]
MRLSKRAEADLEALPAPVRRKADEVIASLDAGELVGKKLVAQLQGLRSARVGRTHRLIYKLTDAGPFVVAVPPRRDAYR